MSGPIWKPTPRRREPKPLRSKPNPVTPRAAFAVYSRDGYQCQWCQTVGGALVPHHRLLRSQGGKDIPEHLVSVHPLCHRYIHDHPAEAKERGFIVSSEADLAERWST